MAASSSNAATSPACPSFRFLVCFLLIVFTLANWFPPCLSSPPGSPPNVNHNELGFAVGLARRAARTFKVRNAGRRSRGKGGSSRKPDAQSARTGVVSNQGRTGYRAVLRRLPRLSSDSWGVPHRLRFRRGTYVETHGIRTSVQVSLRGYQKYEVQFNAPIPGDVVFADFRATYRNFSQERFFGTGQNSKKENQRISAFRSRVFKRRSALIRKVRPRFLRRRSACWLV